jgi:hexosaminidase
MKHIAFSFILSLVLSLFAFGQTDEINIIPQPKSVKHLPGEFELNYKTKLIVTDDVGRKSANLLNDLLMKNYSFKLEYVSNGKSPKKNVIVFLPATESAGKMPNEAYGLNITPKAMQIAGSETGQFYALQSLMQLLPVEFKGKTKLPAVDILDEPRFKYRGMHLDVGRHFMPVEFVKKYIDLMSQYKFNTFHWHLTEDQGWRIEIKKYPRLTEIGSKRKETMLEKNFTPYKGDGVPVEGFYTQDQIRDVVAFATARHITVIPEIELPGHSSAALTAYPELGCRENYNYRVQTTWGIFKEVYCPSDKTFQFLEDVISEVVDLFPDSPYIHIGGDEVLKDFWKDSPIVKELQAKEGLKDEHEVQSYFIRRMEKFINSKGKRIIGWDEILEGGTAPNATIMSWRGEKGGIEAAKAKHDVIMTPNSFLYFDYGQGDPKYEPINIGNYLPLDKVYSYNPEPAELNADEKKYIIGAQANVWTEYIKTPEKVEYMVFPRILALSEVVWSPLEKKDFADFSRRLLPQFARLDKQNVNYRIPAPIGLQNILINETDKARIELKSPIPNGKIFYTTDASEPTESSKLYDKPIELTLKPNETVEFKTIVVNAKGRKSVTYVATVLRREMLKAVDLKDKSAGISLKFYKGGFKSVKDFDTLSPIETTTSKSIQLPQFAKKTNELKDSFGASFEGFIYVPEDAIYEFELESDDGANLQIGGETIVDLDGGHSVLKKAGIIPLSKGYHKLNLRYFQAGGDAVLNLCWGIKGTGLRRIYGNELFVPIN